MLAAVAWLTGCAAQDDLRQVSRSLDARIMALQATVSELQESLENIEGPVEEVYEANRAIRRSQADLNADVISIRDDLQRIRGAQEELQMQVARSSGPDGVMTDDLRGLLERIEARLLVVEARLGIADDDAPPPREARPSEPERPRDSETLYSEAYGLFREGDYDGSRKQFLEFLEAFPDTEYSDNARFWIGESYYFQGEYEPAILEYQKVIEDYPQGSRVPHALLKQALSFERLEETSSALLLLQRVVRDYPGTTAAETARSKLLELR